MAIAATPALAADGVEVNVSPSTVSMKAGEQAAVRIEIDNKSAAVTPVTGNLTVQLPSSVSFSDTVQNNAFLTGCSISNQGKTAKCTLNIPKGQKGQVQLQVGAQQGTPTTSLSASVEVQASVPDTGDKSFTVSVTASSNTAGVLGVTGTVTDAAGAAVPGADVTATDSANKVRATTTNDQGVYVIDVQTDPFKPGQIVIQAKKTGFAIGKLTKTGVAGQPITNADLKLALSASPSASASASASAAAPTTAPTSATVTEDTSTKAGKGDGGGGLLMWLIIGFGILLIGGGGAAIFFLLRKGKDDDDSGAGKPSPTVYGGGSGTGIRRPVADDSPTMMHQGPLVTDDPYADPRTQAYGGYPGRTDQYGAPADPYAAPPAAPPTQQYGRPTDPYAEPPAPPTQQYGARPAADPYADQTQQYRPQQQPQQDERTQQYRPAQDPNGAPRQQGRPLDWLDD
ncbi:carboxypeptidase-like regulatory domain-containing protein [Longispora sp. K20-0274]|uniref:carboxypeptidase-like regulatory domain-containing protein n=1 Tax=Longispora sp. K20-0274 TaxID=3088255 RepID=UPI00399BFE1F